jgi:non-ribosomal peptide synthetase component E (peptide arylation enzyme)
VGEEQQAIDAMSERRDMNLLPKCEANYAPLTPLRFLERAASVHGDRVSVIYGELSYTWTQTFERCRRLASAVSRLASAGDTVLTPSAILFFFKRFFFFILYFPLPFETFPAAFHHHVC